MVLHPWHARRRPSRHSGTLAARSYCTKQVGRASLRGREQPRPLTAKSVLGLALTDSEGFPAFGSGPPRVMMGGWGPRQTSRLP